MRHGYFIEACSDTVQYKEHKQNSNKDVDHQCLSELYAWKYLQQLLSRRIDNPHQDCFNLEYYSKAKESMDKIAEDIKTQNDHSLDTQTDREFTSPELTELWSHRDARTSRREVKQKKIALEESMARRQQYTDRLFLATKHIARSYSNSFMVGNEFELFKDVFEKVEIVPVFIDLEKDTAVAEPPLKFSFDLYLNENCKKTESLPSYKIIVLGLVIRY